MPATAPRAPTPTMAATKIATSSVGNATERLMNAGHEPADAAADERRARAPSGMPIAAPSPAASTASDTDSRVATSTR